MAAPAIHGLLVGVTVELPASLRGIVGCQPAAFSTSEVYADGGRGREVVDVAASDLCDPQVDAAGLASTGVGNNATERLRQRVAGHVALVSMLSDWNPWVAWDQSFCTPVHVAVTAHRLGAEAVVFSAHYVTQVPYSIVAAYPSDQVPMPVCMTWRAERDRIVAALELGPVMLSLGEFRLYSHADNPAPAHAVTSLQLLNPPALKWSYPAGQATFNPSELSPLVGEVVRARFGAGCEYPAVAPLGYLTWDSWEGGCGPCFYAPLRNESTLRGGVALFYFEDEAQKSPCFTQYYEITWLAQRAGATAVVFSSYADFSIYLLAPYLVPFDVTAPTLQLHAVHAALWAERASSPAAQAGGGAAALLVARTPQLHMGFAF